MGGFDQLALIFWVQQKTLRNSYARSAKGGAIFTIIISAIWYGGTALSAAFVAYGLAMSPPDRFRNVLGSALFGMTCIWQGFPILMGSSGAYIDIRRLLVYPIPVSKLFTLEVVLRISTALEMGILLAGAMLGLTFNRDVRLWSPFALVLFALFNLLLSAGVKQLFNRLAERKYIREMIFLVMILALLLPQTLMMNLHSRNLQQSR